MAMAKNVLILNLKRDKSRQTSESKIVTSVVALHL